jgi:hypothetical protein
MRTLQECDERLRATVQAEDFEGSRLAIAEYRQAFDLAWSNMSDAERRGSEMSERASVLMSWALCMFTLFRTGLYARRRSVKAAGRYVQSRRSSLGHTWGVAG